MHQTSFSLAFRIVRCLPGSPEQLVLICFLLQERLLTWFLKAEELPAFCDSLYCDSVGPPLVSSRVKFLRMDRLCCQARSHLSYTDRSTTALLHGQDTSQQGPEPLARCARPAGAWHRRPVLLIRKPRLAWFRGELQCPKRQRDSLGARKPAEVNSARRR